MAVPPWGRGGGTCPSKSWLGPQIVVTPPNLAVLLTCPSKSWLGPQIVVRPPNLAVLLTHSGQFILRQISKFDATRCQNLRLNAQNSNFRCGSARDPAGGAYSAPPDSLAV